MTTEAILSILDPSSQSEAYPPTMNVLVDHNLKGHAVILSGHMVNRGWRDWIDIRLIPFEKVESADSATPRLRN